jgi:hypothetical protein
MVSLLLLNQGYSEWGFSMNKYLAVFALFLLIIFVFILNSDAADVPKGCVEKEGLVFCGPKNCLTTSAGNVACGGLSDVCRTTSTGNVACGGLSKDCRISSTGKIACGGLAKECHFSFSGEVACGGSWNSN